MTHLLRVVWIFCAAAALASSAAAAGSFEIFAGYSVTRTQPSGSTDRTTINSWDTSLSFYPKYRLGITTAFSGFYGAAYAGPAVSDGSGSVAALSPVSVRQYSFLAGPQLRLLSRSRIETSVRALFGAAYNRNPSASYSISDSASFAALFGSNFDLRINKRVAMRFSPGIYLTQFNGVTQRDFRFSIGPVFRLGGGE
jgi:hypothetical protein